MTANELRQKYIEFFKSKEHSFVSSASLIPENDPTILFTTAGMHPLVPYLLGQKHPGGDKLVSVQKCIRTGDIDEVGNATHHTFFEMLGNWSLGSYFKKETIEWSYEFLTEHLGLDKDLIAVSIFEGDDDAPFDQESFDIWKGLGISEQRIAKLPKKNNWWGPAGKTGPCGPDSEVFYWTGNKKEVPESFNDDHESWVEIWNDVFMEYNKGEDEKYSSLKQKNIDTGMGLERVLAIMNGFSDNYKTELWADIIKKIEELSNKEYGEETRIIRIIADHIKASVFIIGDDKGVSPSNTDQGYIARRLIRRAARYGRKLGIEKDLWINDVAEVVIDIYKDTYNELERNREFVLNNIVEEEKKFNITLINGEKKIEGKSIDGESAFNLFQTYGYPVEMTEEIAKEKGIELSYNFTKEFNKAMEKHRELSRTASAGKFKGGLADTSEDTTKLHTAAHLLLAALRKVFGNHISQRGSNITAERLRFDFSHPEKLTDEEKDKIENLVNEAIAKDLKVSFKEMTVEEAKKKGACGAFESKYGEMVKVYKVGEEGDLFSYEICGGPHVESIGKLGKFKIKKEQSSSAGVRRIKATLH